MVLAKWKKIESKFNSVIISYLLNFASSHLKQGLLTQGTVVVYNRTPIEPSFFSCMKMV